MMNYLDVGMVGVAAAAVHDSPRDSPHGADKRGAKGLA